MNKRKKIVFLSLISVFLIFSFCLTIFSSKETIADDSFVPPAVLEVYKDSRVSEVGVDEKGGAIYVGKGSTYVMSGGVLNNKSNTFGGAVFVDEGGTFIMESGMISNCQAYLGGAIYLAEGAKCHIQNGIITGCMAESGAAIFTEGNCEVIIDDPTTIYGNNDGYEYGSKINVYVDDVFVTTIKQKTLKIKEENLPYSYEQCCGYYLNRLLTNGVSDGTSILNLPKDSVIAPEGANDPPYDPKFLPEKETNRRNAVNSSYVSNGIPTINLFTKLATEGLVYNLNSDGKTYSVSAPKNVELPFDIVIAKEYEDKPVTNIKSAGFQFQKEILNVVMPDSIKHIEEIAFHGCELLSSIKISEQIKTIGENAFDGCYSLENLYIESLTSWLNIDFDITERYLNANPMFLGINIDQNVYIEDFRTPTTKIILPEISEIKKGSFVGFLKLTDVEFPSSLKTIGEFAFANCGFDEINLLEGVQTIKREAFAWCPDLIKVALPSSLEVLEEKVFLECYNLSALYIHKEVELIYASEIEESPLLFDYSVKIYTDVTEPQFIPEGWSEYFYFSDYDYPVEIAFNSSQEQMYADFAYSEQFPDFVIRETTITKYVGNGGVVVIPDVVTQIAYYAFASLYEPSSITSVVLPESLRYIEMWAFACCDSLTSVTLPSNLVSLGYGAFADCYSLSSVYVPSSIDFIDSYAFSFCLDDLVIYTDLKSTDSTPEGWSDGWNNNEIVDFRIVYDCSLEEFENIVSLGESSGDDVIKKALEEEKDEIKMLFYKKRKYII